MFYAILAAIMLVLALLSAGGAAYVTNTYCKAGIYKAQVTALKNQLSKVRDLTAEANKEESNDNATENANKDLIHEVEKAIASSTDNPECSGTEFLRKLRELR